MGMLSRRQALVAGAGAVTAAGLTRVATAQPPLPAGAVPPGALPAGAAPGGTAGGEDPMLAGCLLVTGRKQIEVCRFALEKIQNDDVKAFAKAEIDEHEDMKRKLTALGFQPPPMSGGAAPSGTGAVTPAGGTRVQVGRVDVAGGTPAASAGAGAMMVPPGAAQMLAVDAEVKEQCITTARSELGKLEGVKFDKAFVGSQLYAHYDLFDHGVVFRKHSSPALGAILDDAKKVIETHIATCKSLMEKLESAKNG